ncbi:MAG: hypothetical protein V4621_07800 [Pseudomonadota bacterium]
MEVTEERRMLALKIIEVIGDWPFVLSFQTNGSEMHLVSNMTEDSIKDMLESNLEHINNEQPASEQVH